MNSDTETLFTPKTKKPKFRLKDINSSVHYVTNNGKLISIIPKDAMGEPFAVAPQQPIYAPPPPQQQYYAPPPQQYNIPQRPPPQQHMPQPQSRMPMAMPRPSVINRLR